MTDEFIYINEPGGQEIRIGDEKVANFKSQLDKLKNLKTIHIEGVLLSARALDVLIDQVARQRNLRRLILVRFLSVRPENIKDMRLKMSRLIERIGSTIYELDLHGCSIESEVLIGFLKSNCCKELRRLSLRLNDFSESESVLIAKTIESIASPSFESLCWQNLLGDAGVDQFLQTLRGMQQLTELHFIESGVTADNVSAFINVLREKPKLSSLSLSGNRLGKNGASKLVAFFRSIKSLKDVDVSCCKLSTKSLNVVKSLAAGNANIEKISLRRNRIKIDEAIKLMAVINEKLPKIRSIDLTENRMTNHEFTELSRLCVCKDGFVLQSKVNFNDDDASSADSVACEEKLRLQRSSQIESLFTEKNLEKFKETTKENLVDFFTKDHKNDPLLPLKMITKLSNYYNEDKPTVLKYTKLIWSAFFEHFDDYEEFAVVCLKHFGFFESEELPVVSGVQMKNVWIFIAEQKLIPEQALDYIRCLKQQCPKPKKKTKEELAALDLNFELELCFNPGNKVLLSAKNILDALN